MRPYQNWNCGDATCPVRSPEGKRFERVITWSELSLGTIHELISLSRIQRVSGGNSLRGVALLAFMDAFERAKALPFDQAAHERLWVLGEAAANYLEGEERALLSPWIPPFCNSIPEMAFCRVADGWKYYIEKKSGLSYGESRRIQSPVHQLCDKSLNALRNLLVHGSGFLEADDRGGRRYTKFVDYAREAGSHIASNPLLKIPQRIAALNDGDIVMLNSSETVEYIQGIKEMFLALE